MSNGDIIDRRSVLKSTGAAITGVGMLGAAGTAAAQQETAGGTINITLPYVDESLTVTVEITFGTCEYDAYVDVEGVVEENIRLTCDNYTRSFSFDLAAIEGDVELEADFTNQCVTVAVEGRAWHFTGWASADEEMTLCA